MPTPTPRLRLFFLLFSTPISAGAQGNSPALSDAGAATSASTTAPVARTEARVTYPAGARGEAEVTLELVIGVSGDVRDAKVIDGVEPFATAARVAAASWQFDPATQGGRPVPAR